MTNQTGAFVEQVESCDIPSIINPADIPEHIAIIMDGNRRWAKSRGLNVTAGYWAGAENLTKIVRDASDLGVKALTVYAFSTENWQRPDDEVAALMELFRVYLIKQCLPMQADGVRLKTIGDLSKLPIELQEIIQYTKEKTASGNKIDLILAVNYGARDEIIRAVTKIIDDFEEKRLSKNEITEELLSQYLDTSHQTDPDLLIRTSGEMRLSNFLLWQISYAEVIVSDILWPDFSKENLYQAIMEYQKRDRRLGKL